MSMVRMKSFTTWYKVAKLDGVQLSARRKMNTIFFLIFFPSKSNLLNMFSGHVHARVRIYNLQLDISNTFLSYKIYKERHSNKRRQHECWCSYDMSFEVCCADVS